MTIEKERNRDGPGTYDGAGRHIFARTAAPAPSHPERTPQLASYNIAEKDQKSQTTCPPLGREFADSRVLLRDSGWLPGDHFAEVRTVVVVRADAVPQGRAVDGILFGRWNPPPPENNPNIDLAPSGVCVPPTPPVLEGGAAVRIEEEEIVLVG